MQSLSIGKKLAFGFGACAIIIAAIIGVVYGAFKATSETITYQANVFTDFQQMLSDLSESQWRTTSRIQTMYVAETPNDLESTRAQASAALERSQTLLEDLRDPRFARIHALLLKVPGRFEVTPDSLQRLESEGVREAELEVLSPLLDRGVIGRSELDATLASVPAIQDDDETLALIDTHTAHRITVRDGLDRVEKSGVDMAQIRDESFAQMTKLLEFRNDREAIVDALAQRRGQLTPLRSDRTEPFLDRLDLQLSKLVLGGSAGSIRSNKRRVEGTLRDIVRRTPTGVSTAGVDIVLKQVETASKVLEDNAKTRDTTIFLQHTLDDRQNELDTLLKSVTTLLSVEGESLSRTVLAEMQTFVRTVGTLGVAGIAFSLVVGWLIRRSIVAPLDVLVGAAKRVSAKDLTQGSALRSLAKRRDEFGDLGGTFLSMEDSLREMIRGLKEGIRNLSKNSAAIAEAAQQGAATASEQASTVAQVTVTTEELLQTSKAATTSASEVAASSDKAAERGRSGQDAVLEASRIVLALNERVSEIASRIMDLGEQSKQIGGIIDTVNALAEQSSLLAVNASIEASKAGEQGRGFAVVAVEVRRLAEQSKRATNQIRTILGDTQQATNTAIMAAEEGNKQADRARDTIEPMRELVERLATILDENADRARHIVGSSSEQAAGVEQIAGAMESVSQASSHSSDGARDLERSAVALSELSTDLEKLISGYRLG